MPRPKFKTKTSTAGCFYEGNDLGGGKIRVPGALPKTAELEIGRVVVDVKNSTDISRVLYFIQDRKSSRLLVSLRSLFWLDFPDFKVSFPSLYERIECFPSLEVAQDCVTALEQLGRLSPRPADWEIGVDGYRIMKLHSEHLLRASDCTVLTEIDA